MKRWHVVLIAALVAMIAVASLDLILRRDFQRAYGPQPASVATIP